MKKEECLYDKRSFGFRRKTGEEFVLNVGGPVSSEKRISKIKKTRRLERNNFQFVNHFTIVPDCSSGKVFNNFPGEKTKVLSSDSHVQLSLKFGYFTSFSERERQRNVQKCNTHAYGRCRVIGTTVLRRSRSRGQ